MEQRSEIWTILTTSVHLTLEFPLIQRQQKAELATHSDTNGIQQTNTSNGIHEQDAENMEKVSSEPVLQTPYSNKESPKTTQIEEKNDN